MNVPNTKQISGETIILKTVNSVHLLTINMTREIKQNTLVIWYSTRRDVEPMGRALYKLNKSITKTTKSGLDPCESQSQSFGQAKQALKN